MANQRPPMPRRTFTANAARSVIGATAALSGCRSTNRTQGRLLDSGSSDEFEFIIVGSGAGGGPLAANLARAGRKVLLLEAGDDDAAGYNYAVPAFHGFATEDSRLAWNFYVNHYASNPERDSKYVPGKGILYPRAGTLGGCTAHNALITMVPQNSDWDKIADATGDSSWASGKMRRYFQKVERCQYLTPQLESSDALRHGYSGWLPTKQNDPALLLSDLKLLSIARGAADLMNVSLGLSTLFKGSLDPNAWGALSHAKEGVYNTPISVGPAGRSGAREVLRAAQELVPDNLTIRMRCLATKILFDENKRAVGVEYLEGAKLYRAAPDASGTGVRHHARATREVILSGGAFNSPQLLLLSGVGPAAELNALGIQPIVDLPGVGKNLQDRYEVGVVNKMAADFALLRECKFDPPDDPCYDDFLNESSGPFATNGVTIGVAKKSTPAASNPDLFVFGLPSAFSGYKPGYSQSIREQKNMFTWAVLKGHTKNRAGTVTLRTSDARDTPDINFNYFDETNDPSGSDLSAVVEGIKFARKAMRDQGATEVVPGPSVRTDEQLKTFVRNECWGHHASCSNKMGSPNDPTAVVDSNFRVIGTKGLRIVDASIFPEIPGLFIVMPTYMISEKAAEVILADT